MHPSLHIATPSHVIVRHTPRHYRVGLSCNTPRHRVGLSCRAYSVERPIGCEGRLERSILRGTWRWRNPRRPRRGSQAPGQHRVEDQGCAAGLRNRAHARAEGGGALAGNEPRNISVRHCREGSYVRHARHLEIMYTSMCDFALEHGRRSPADGWAWCAFTPCRLPAKPPARSGNKVNLQPISRQVKHSWCRGSIGCHRETSSCVCPRCRWLWRRGGRPSCRLRG